MTESPIAQLLLDAADVAERTGNRATAVNSAWSALHDNRPGNEWPARPLMMAAFEVWAASEDVSHWRQYLADVVRRRCHSAHEVAESLRRAAKTVA